MSEDTNVQMCVETCKQSRRICNAESVMKNMLELPPMLSFFSTTVGTISRCASEFASPRPATPAPTIKTFMSVRPNVQEARILQGDATRGSRQEVMTRVSWASAKPRF